MKKSELKQIIKEEIEKISKGDIEISKLEKEAKKFPKDDIRFKNIQKKIGDLKQEKEYGLPGSEANKKFSIKEQDDDFEDEEYMNEDWAEQDGWNQEFFEENGLMSLLGDFSKVAYELQNARRGSYGINGDTLEDLKDTLMELSEELQDIINDLD
jgi:hypothetical protein